MQKLSQCKQDVKCDLWLSKRFKNMCKSFAIQIWIIFECWPWLKPRVHLFDSKIMWEKESCCILVVFLQKWVISSVSAKCSIIDIGQDPYRSCGPEAFCKKFKMPTKFTGKHLRQGLSFDKATSFDWNFIKKEVLVQVFSCEFCEIFKNTVF